MKFIRNLTALLVSDVFSKAIQFVVLGYLARTLGTEGLGTFVWVQSVLLIFGLFPNFGLNEYGILRVAPDRSQENISRIVSDILNFRMFAAALGVGTLIVLIYTEPHFTEYQALLLAGSSVLVIAVVGSDWLFTALEKQALIGLYRFVARAVYLGAVLAFVRSSDDVMPAVVVYVAGEAVFSLGLFIHARRATQWSWVSVGLGRLKLILQSAWPFAVLMANGSVLYYIDLFLIGILLPMQEAGIYGGALRIVAPFISIKYLFGQLIYPKLARWTANPEDVRGLNVLTETINRYGTLMGLALVSVLILFSRELVVLVLGPAFASAWWAFSLLSLALFAEFCWIAFPYLTVCINTKLYTGIVLVTTVGKVLALLLIVPIFGVTGGAIVYSASTLMIFILSVIYVRRHSIAVPVVKLMVGPSVLAALMLAAAFALESPWPRLAAWVSLLGVSAAYLALIGQRFSRSRITEDLHIMNA